MKPKSEEASNTLTEHKMTSHADQQAEDQSEGHEETSLNGNPTPFDFDIFLPWVCLKWACVKHVSVKRKTQEPYMSKKEKSTFTKLKMAKSKPSVDRSHESDLIDDLVIRSAGVQTDDLDDTVQITTIYDIKGTLVEIAFHKQHDVPLKVVHALSFCFPYHTNLTKLSFCDGGLTSCLLQEISKILPNSNITNLNLSGNYVPEGNYYTLFDHMSQLRCLTLSRCKLNDDACNELMAKLESGHSIVMLDFSFNCLTDEAARSIGHMLRSNRTLLHLNLSGNTITSDGALAILASLSEFLLTVKELMDMKRRKIIFIENKIAIYTRCLEEVSIKKSQQGPRKSIKISPTQKSEKSPEEMAERMVSDIVGEFNDPFNCNGTIRKEGQLYCRGNFTLCSLNMSYNNLDYFSLKHIHKVLQYQSECLKPDEMGLLRIVIEGNPCPKEAADYFEIDELLRVTLLKTMQPTIQPTKNQKITYKMPVG